MGTKCDKLAEDRKDEKSTTKADGENNPKETADEKAKPISMETESGDSEVSKTEKDKLKSAQKERPDEDMEFKPISEKCDEDDLSTEEEETKATLEVNIAALDLHYWG